MSMANFPDVVDHQFLKEGVVINPKNHHLYTYITAANGVHLLAWRPGLEVLLPLIPFNGNPIRGLRMIDPYVRLAEPVPMWLLRKMLTESRRAMPNEMLFYLVYEQEWKLFIPEQQATPWAVKPLSAYDSPDVLVEVHSHNSMGAFFSAADDAEETGFRIYGVLGRVNGEKPEIALRVGLYGHFLPVNVESVFAAADWQGIGDGT